MLFVQEYDMYDNMTFEAKKYEPIKLDPIFFRAYQIRPEKFRADFLHPGYQGQVEQSSLNAIEPTSDLSNCSAPSSGPSKPDLSPQAPEAGTLSSGPFFHVYLRY